MSVNRRLQILGLIVLLVLVICAFGIAEKKQHEGPTPHPSPMPTVSTGGPTI